MMQVVEYSIVINVTVPEEKYCPFLNQYCQKNKCMAWVSVVEEEDGKSIFYRGRCGLIPYVCGNVLHEFPNWKKKNEKSN